ncbi:MAG: hemerythrin domain-containing protein [Rhodocyclaceae bacterium]
MQALRIIQDEHQALAGIIHAVHYMLKEIGAGQMQPDFRLLRAMVHYLDAYPEQRHHPREDHYLFARLKQLTGDGAEAIARLEREHAMGDARMQALNDAVRAYEADPTGRFDDFVRAFDTFADFYRSHMMLEEREIFPLCRKHFSSEDWRVIDAAFRENRDPMTGEALPVEQEDFQRIFSRLVAAAPPPIGLGAGLADD